MFCVDGACKHVVEESTGVNSIDQALETAIFKTRTMCLRHEGQLHGCPLPYNIHLEPFFEFTVPYLSLV